MRNMIKCIGKVDENGINLFKGEIVSTRISDKNNQVTKEWF